MKRFLSRAIVLMAVSVLLAPEISHAQGVVQAQQQPMNQAPAEAPTVPSFPVPPILHASREEAQAMCEKAAVVIQKLGPQAGFQKIQGTPTEFIDRDLYVFVLDHAGKFVVYTSKPELVGRDVNAVADSTGFLFVKAYLAVSDRGWVDFKWPDPYNNTQIRDRSTYIIHVGDYFVGVSYYKDADQEQAQ